MEKIFYIVIKYYFATQNNILCVIGYEISNGPPKKINFVNFLEPLPQCFTLLKEK